VNRLRNRLILVFLAATVIPLAATLWITTALIERSLSYATTEELDRLSRSLEETAREFYQRSRQALKEDADSNRIPPHRYADAEAAKWPAPVLAFWDSGESERFSLSGPEGSYLDYMVRGDSEVWVYTQDLGKVRMEQLTSQIRGARELAASAAARDLQRGFTMALLVLVVAVWVVSLVALVFLAHRISQPIQLLTGGLAQLSAGNLDVRLETRRVDETGRAIQAFNDTAAQLKQSRERLVYLTQVASWQLLARKMAHELKNSLTPIRLTVEEILARQPQSDRPFMQQAVQIVVNEIETLERRVRAFSEFSSEPAAKPSSLDINAILQERVSFLKAGHVDVTYRMRLAGNQPQAFADADHVKGILTNLLENAAEAAGAAGEVLGVTYTADGKTVIEIHDSGPGLNEEATRSLFEPTITFKKKGMGLGLSIARKNALLCGGDIMLIEGELRGAAFRVVLPSAGRG
jgi:nitrogen fixation/metabolism regulation signal transduction histidine kinase